MWLHVLNINVVLSRVGEEKVRSRSVSGLRRQMRGGDKLRHTTRLMHSYVSFSLALSRVLFVTY